MLKLFRFISSNLVFILFILLEITSFLLIYTFNTYQSIQFFNTSNQITANVIEVSNQMTSYFNLQTENEKLALENAKLKKILSQREIKSDVSYFNLKDSSLADKYDYVTAKVINSSTAFYNNFLTINKGSLDEIQPGMAIVTSNGIVGKIKTVSPHYSTCFSLLHHDMIVSSKLKRTKVIGAIKWIINDASRVSLLYVPRYVDVKKGDTVLTSQYNSVFPEGEMIGRVENVDVKSDEKYQNITVRLFTDFYKLSHVYVIKNKQQIEQDTLEKPLLKELNERN